MSEPTVDHATFVIERVFSVPPPRVFAAWSDPAAHERWFVQGEGWDIVEYQHDFRVGGLETGRFSQDGTVFYSNDTHYDDIVPDERIVFSYTMARDGTTISASLATIELLASGKGTRMIFTEQGAFLNGGDKAADREQGWNGLFDALAKELERVALNA
jgi:uncharacterized protein YndB with AHSA1/START domain